MANMGTVLYRLSTILDVNNTAFIVPVMDDYMEISGMFPVLPTLCQIVQYGGEPWLRYQFRSGQFASIEMRYCGIMTKFQYTDDFFGEDNSALSPTMELINIQNQGIAEGVKARRHFGLWRIKQFFKAGRFEKRTRSVYARKLGKRRRDCPFPEYIQRCTANKKCAVCHRF